MALDPSVVIFDSCVLYPFHLRNIVVQVAVDRLVDARWLDEAPEFIDILQNQKLTQLATRAAKRASDL